MDLLRLVVLGCAVLCAPVWASAKDTQAKRVLEAAKLALETCDYPNALPRIEALARQGNSDAQLALGMAYREGIGGIAKSSEGTDWIGQGLKEKERLAAAGDPDAMISLSRVYYGGWAGETNEALGKEWLDRAMARRAELATTGDTEAQYDLAGDFRYRVKGGEKDAQKWSLQALPALKAAALGGDTRAQFRLAGMYEYGHGVEVDESEAKRWYKLALVGLNGEAEKGDVDAMFSLYSIAFHDSVGLGSDVNARRWHDEVVLKYRAAASAGCLPAQAWLADRLNLMWILDRNRGQSERYRHQSLMWWTIIASSADRRYRSLIEKAQKEKMNAKLSLLEQELVSNKAARCVQTNYRICE